MSVSTTVFLTLFFPLIILVYYLPSMIIKKLNESAVIRYQNIILAVASIGLYTLAETKYIIFLIFSIIFNHCLTGIMVKYNKKIFGIVAVSFDVLSLGFFKILCMPSMSDKLSFPIGMSFFVFKEVSFVIDTMRDYSVCDKSLLANTLYISNFMTIVSGPINDYKHEIAQIKNRRIKQEEIYNGTLRIVCGLFKKIIIADSLKQLVTWGFTLSSRSIITGWMCAVAYTIELYMDFSGYTDIAVGLGKMFGFSFLENFNKPYLANSICDFWKRWHISLTKWFTKYLYFPLGGSRVKTIYRHLFNLFFVWFCTAIWHGVNWTFIIWGMIYFIFQSLEKYTKLKRISDIPFWGRFYTLMVIILCWVIFNSASLYSAIEYIGSMFGVTANSFFNYDEMKMCGYYVFPLTLGIILSTNLIEITDNRIGKANTFLFILKHIILIASFISTISVMISRGYTAPLYGSF